MSSFGIYDLYFNNQVKMMNAGIEATMKKESLHLCTLALSTYTEVMGGLITGKLKEEGHSKENYESFLPYLGKGYVELNEMIIKYHSKTLGSLHKAVRSKLVHEFSLRPSYAIWINELPNDDKIGVELIVNKTDQCMFEHLNFNVSEYYRDFKSGVTKYHNKLKNWKKNQTTFGNFLKATVLDFTSSENSMPDEKP